MTCKNHEWEVFSTAIAERWLMVQCLDCGLHGTVNDPTKKEWTEGFSAPTRPYRWHDQARVVIHDEHPKSRPGAQNMTPSPKKCVCDLKLGVPEPGAYERFWIEATTPKPFVTPEARQEFLCLATLAEGTHVLCSRLFPALVEGYQQYTGRKATYAVRRFTKQLKTLGMKGIHFSSSEIANLLRELATLLMPRTVSDGCPARRTAGRECCPPCRSCTPVSLNSPSA
jgi:hypothetical protein